MIDTGQKSQQHTCSKERKGLKTVRLSSIGPCTKAGLLGQPGPGIVVVVLFESKLGDAGASHWQDAYYQDG